MKKQYMNNSNDNGFKHNDPMKKMGHASTESRQELEKKAQCGSTTLCKQCKGCSSTKACQDKNCSQYKSGMPCHNDPGCSEKKGKNGSNKY